MLISEVIEEIKKNCFGIYNGKQLTAETTRDKILYGSDNKECTGIVTTIYGSIDVIKEAIKNGCNLIIEHESLFWNHGDKQDWIADFPTFIEKKKLLDEGNITVWRCHDYIHSGINENGQISEGISYGIMKELGYEKYLNDDIARPLKYKIPRVATKDFAKEIMDKMGLNGIECIGNIDGYSENIAFAKTNILGSGENDNNATKYIEEENIDTYITMELIDYTTAEYVKDSSLAGQNKRIFNIGHFNYEEVGMKYFAKFIGGFLPDIKCIFAKAGDMYNYIIK